VYKLEKSVSSVNDSDTRVGYGSRAMVWADSFKFRWNGVKGLMTIIFFIIKGDVPTNVPLVKRLYFSVLVKN